MEESIKTKKRMMTSSLVEQLPPSGIREFFDLVIGMEDVVSLGVGEPDFVTPWRIREAAIYAIEKGYTSYTSNYGMFELRQVISDYIFTKSGITYNPETELCITVGVSQGFDITMRAILNPGDEVIIPEPCYVAYMPLTILAGGKAVMLPSSAKEEFSINFDRLEDSLTERTKAILINYPNNPTGMTLREEELERLARIAIEHDLIIISDEVYGELTYEGEHVWLASIGSLKKRTILLSGCSKAFAMTGWRIGYVAAPVHFIEPIVKIHQYSMLCAPIMSQMAAKEAFLRGESEVTKMKEEYKQRRNIIVEGFNRIGLKCLKPEGAFYVFPSIESTGLNSEDFCTRLLLEEKVAVVPGTAFGKSGSHHIRCAYAASIDDITTALEKIERFCNRL